MKKSVIIMIALISATTLFAQKPAVNSAYTHYRNQYYDKAKTAIDKACLHPDTKDDAKTWMFKGNIYLMLTTNEKYKKLCENPVEEAYDAFIKAQQLNSSKEFQVDMGQSTPAKGLRTCSQLLFNQAIDLINHENYKEALRIAEKSYKGNAKDMDARYLYALTLELTGDTANAKNQYRSLINDKTNKVEPYIRLSQIYKNENDTTHAVRVIGRKSILKDTNGKVNVSYAIHEAGIYVWAGEMEKATMVMNKALEADPENYTLLVNMGTAMTDAKQFDKAEELLMKANSIKPGDYLILYNLGNNYYNHYADIFNKMNILDVNEEKLYDQLKDSSQILLRKALPYLEQAEAIDPNDKNTLIMLKWVYARIYAKEGDPDFNAKLKEVNEKLNALQ